MVEAQQTGNHTAHEEIDLGTAEQPTNPSREEENPTSFVPRIPHHESATTSPEPLIVAENTVVAKPSSFINRILPATWWPTSRKRSAGWDSEILSLRMMDAIANTFREMKSNLELWRVLMIGITYLGTGMGALLGSSLSIECSIDTSISFAMGLFIFGTIGQVFLPKLALFLISRFVAGVGQGIMLVVATIYISDIATPANRGALVLAFWAEHRYSVVKRCPVVFAGIFWIMSLKLPNSPRFLRSRGHSIEAQNILARLRKTARPRSNFPGEYDIAEPAVALDSRSTQTQRPGERNSCINTMFSSWSEICGSKYRKRIMQGVLLLSMPPASAFAVLRYRSIFGHHCVVTDDWNGWFFYYYENLIRLGGLVICYLLIDRWGRRPLLLYGSAVSAVFLSFATAVAYLAFEIQCGQVPMLTKWLGLAVSGHFYLVFSATWGTVPIILAAEIFPSRLRAKGFAISVCGSSFVNIINDVLWFYVPAPPWLLLALLSLVCLAAGVWVYFDIRETKGLGFEQIDSVYQNKCMSSRAVDEEVELQATR
ncbi:MFS general substrate transporter [Glarea lozoyensis ATCC 20868]|uniref:MFS general substrate transporter n=1 Tax=Glarea lozoyensis (strain ATCC 20868 / MF5171) TaxID=1116229 RepID=S3DB16_GLAL2|nr:MFS general substrate transporter [Glarea lozoyensis ATCC 20868]EPE29171.1 MFS general substrate transporter [Glarea lozoyensis ATCC 20868]